MPEETHLLAHLLHPSLQGHFKQQYNCILTIKYRQLYSQSVTPTPFVSGCRKLRGNLFQGGGGVVCACTCIRGDTDYTVETQYTYDTKRHRISAETPYKDGIAAFACVARCRAHTSARACRKKKMRTLNAIFSSHLKVVDEVGMAIKSDFHLLLSHSPRV
jgi:hypothetical protein